MPIFVFDEATIISERSPILGDGFGQTANKRMFSYVLTGTDDSGIIAQERREIVQAEISAKLSLIDDRAIVKSGVQALLMRRLDPGLMS